MKDNRLAPLGTNRLSQNISMDIQTLLLRSCCVPSSGRLKMRFSILAHDPFHEALTPFGKMINFTSNSFQQIDETEEAHRICTP